MKVFLEEDFGAGQWKFSIQYYSGGYTLYICQNHKVYTTSES